MEVLTVNEAYKPKGKNNVIDKYPWLHPKDPRRHMTDEEILHNTIDLSKSALNDKGKRRL